jgi:hypothetical protein
MIFNVTQIHIENGLWGDCSRCPVALAIAEQFPDKKIEVHGNDITIGGQRFVTPPNVTAFINDFDDVIYHDSCEPFAFELLQEIVDF